MEGLQILGFSQTLGTHEQNVSSVCGCATGGLAYGKGQQFLGEITLFPTLMIFQRLHISVPAPHVEAVTQLSQGLC